MADLKPQAFLSYAHADRDKVTGIKRLLTEHDIRVTWDREFRHGESWSRQMIAELKEADCVIVCWSQTAAKSRIVNNEWFAGYYDDKFVGIALEPDIEYPGLAGEPHHEAWYEWDDDNREERLAGLLASIRAIAARRRPKLSYSDIANIVRRVDRRPQTHALTSALKGSLKPGSPGLCCLFSSNGHERPQEFVKRAGMELIPAHLKTLGIISEGNDESYEFDDYDLRWPDGYRNVDEALDIMLEGLADAVPGDVEDRSDLKACIRATDSVASVFYLEVPLQGWQQADADVIEALLRRFGDAALDTSVSKFFIVFIAAQFYEDSQRKVARPATGLVSRWFGLREDIDEILKVVAGRDAQRGFLPPLDMVARHDVDAWYAESNRVLEIPEENEEDFIYQVHKPYLEKKVDREHYQVVAKHMRDALKSLFLGGGRPPRD